MQQVTHVHFSPKKHRIAPAANVLISDPTRAPQQGRTASNTCLDCLETHKWVSINTHAAKWLKVEFSSETDIVCNLSEKGWGGLQPHVSRVGVCRVLSSWHAKGHKVRNALLLEVKILNFNVGVLACSISLSVWLFSLFLWTDYTIKRNHFFISPH